MPAKRSKLKTGHAVSVPLKAVQAQVDPLYGIIGLRAGQQAFFDVAERSAWLVARRQYGKTFCFGAIATDWMMEEAYTEVLMVSASLRLGSETIRKEAAVWRMVTEKLRLLAGNAGFKLSSNAEDDAGELLDVDAIADLFEHQKLESRLWFDNTRYSRTMTVAPNPDTAVGYTAHMIWDEVGRMPDFKELKEALDPVIASNPKLKFRGVTTPPPDDSHYSYEVLCPPPGMEFPVSSVGNSFRNKEGQLVMILNAWDAHAGGVPLLDGTTGLPLTPEAHRAKALDKTAWDRNYGCKFLRGGTSAISLLALSNAAAAGKDTCLGIDCTELLTA